MEGCQEIGITIGAFPELGELVAQHSQGQPGIEFRVIDPFGLQLAVLVVLDQAVIGMAGKAKRIEPEGIDRWLRRESQRGTCFTQTGQVVPDQVVPEHELRSGSVIIKLLQSGRQITPAVVASLGRVRTNGCELVYSSGLRANFEVDRDAPFEQRFHVHCPCRVSAVQLDWPCGPNAGLSRLQTRLTGAYATSAVMPSSITWAQLSISATWPTHLRLAGTSWVQAGMVRCGGSHDWWCGRWGHGFVFFPHWP